MGLESSFRGLLDRLLQLEEHLTQLQPFLGDTPQQGASALIDDFESIVLDMQTDLKTMELSCLEACTESLLPDRLTRVQQLLSQCNVCYLTLCQRYDMRLSAYTKLKELSRLGSARGGEWRAWARSLQRGIEELRIPLHKGSAAIAECWQEIAEHTGSSRPPDRPSDRLPDHPSDRLSDRLPAHAADAMRQMIPGSRPAYEEPFEPSFL